MKQLTKRTFIIGDEWLYYKLYCGKRIADMLLVDSIKPLTEKLLAEKRIDRWFFIRYSDPHPHLRVRFHTEDIDGLGSIINAVHKAISPYVENDLIWKVQADTYQRELERYGKNTMEEAEYFFYIDSQICTRALALMEDDTLLFIFALRSMNELLDVFDLPLERKLAFVKNNLNAFKAEFNSNKAFVKQLNKKYNGLKQQIIEFMEMENHVDYQPLIDLLTTKNKQLSLLKGKNFREAVEENMTIEQLLSSYNHMMVNRIFRDRQRLHELVCYDSLYRFYNFKLVNS